MTYQEILEAARSKMAPKCKVCKKCNGDACKGVVPGPGGKGTGMTFKRNYSWLAEHVKIHMDVLAENKERDTSIELFGKVFTAPIFCAPIGMLALNYSDAMDEDTYAQAVVCGSKLSGTAAFTGGGTLEKCYTAPLKVIKDNDGWGIPTLKPWRMDIVETRMKHMEESGAFAFAMDIDSGGLAHSQADAANNVITLKSEADLKRIVSLSEKPFIVKGIMTPESALAAAIAGVYGIVVSNHGGRVLDSGLSTAEVLPGIRKAIGSSVKIFVDGGVRSGVDVFKMLALGADAVLVGRPYAIAAYGGGAEGVQFYTEKLISELKDTMTMANCESIKDITENKIVLV